MINCITEQMNKQISMFSLSYSVLCLYLVLPFFRLLSPELIFSSTEQELSRSKSGYGKSWCSLSLFGQKDKLWV